MQCPECKHEIPEDSMFCNKCGCHVIKGTDGSEETYMMESERKLVTVMFSDLSGYTKMTERLDPEEVKAIMSQIFGKITEIIKSYEGFIERIIGDAVMAVFGVPKAHEDDPIRAIRAATDIHKSVEDFSPKFVKKIGHSLTMHTGINTGLVVTGEVDIEKGNYGLTGDAINLASRLESIAKAGEIIVGPETHNQALNFFEFETLEPAKVKGKQHPVHIYKVNSVKKEFFKTHRLQGLQASLTGRHEEMKILVEAAERLKQGQGSIITICGEAGTGKSRLKKEFKGNLDLDAIQWREGHSFGYTQSIPYFPLTNLLTHAFQIEDRDPPEKIRAKVEAGLSYVLDESDKYTPYIGSLFSLDYPEIEGVNPEYWKNKLLESAQAIVSSLADRGPTIICFEDLHWADPSFIEIMQKLLKRISKIALFICTFRSHFSLFNNKLPDEIKEYYRKIHLKDLEPLDAQKMLNSLLKTNSMPNELSDFVRKKTEGNPFYLEEMINSLIESKILARDNGNWKLSREITEADIPATIQGVLSARVDRLDKYFKRVLQEASVIGRKFLYDILKKITEINTSIDQPLLELEDLDLIRKQSLDPELEYIFKHALTQEVVYNGLLKKERQAIHERIGLAIEQLFSDRLPEFYDILAYHFQKGLSSDKAVEYLMKAGDKNMERYSVEESHLNFREAYNILNRKQEESENWEKQQIDLLVRWAPVYYYLGDFRKLTQLLIENETTAESIQDMSTKARFYTWLGISFWNSGNAKKAYEYLHLGLKIGDQVDDKIAVGHSCTILTYICAELSLYDEGLAAGKRAQEIAKLFPSDHYLYFKSLAGMCLIYWEKGELDRVRTNADKLIKYGQKHTNLRSLVMGYYILAFYYFSTGEFETLLDNAIKATQIAADPYYSVIPKLTIGAAYLLLEKHDEAETTLQELVSFEEKTGANGTVLAGYAFYGATKIVKGEMSKGLEIILSAQRRAIKYQRNNIHVASEFVLGLVYFQILEGKGPKNLITLAKNIGFIVKNVPFAFKKGKLHFLTVIEMGNKYGMNGYVSLSHYHLGLMYMNKGKKESAKQHIKKAIDMFNNSGAKNFLKQAKGALESLQ